jgi:hypothetical protein
MSAMSAARWQRTNRAVKFVKHLSAGGRGVVLMICKLLIGEACAYFLPKTPGFLIFSRLNAGGRGAAC